VYYRARYYSPQLGRFISRDPLGLAAGINPYSYVNNNPANLVDPTGLLATSVLSKVSDYAGDVKESIVNLILAGHFKTDAEMDVFGKELRLAQRRGETADFLRQNPAGMWIKDAAALAATAGLGGLGTVSMKNGTFANGVFGEANAEAITLYRGVTSTHPGYSAALSGSARPIGGAADAISHSLGNTRSTFTSWSTDPTVAKSFADISGSGVLLSVTIPKSLTIAVQDNIHVIMNESEVLIKGAVNGARVIRRP